MQPTNNSSIQSCQLPPLLKPGDLAIAIAPSGCLKTTDALEPGIAIWRKRGYRVEFGNNYQANCGYLAGSDRQRREDLAAAWQNPQCKAILAIRGGYGGARLLEDWRWGKGHCKWLLGFSDVTSLLWSLATQKIASLHAPVLTTLSTEPDWAIARMFNYLETGTLQPLQGKPGGGGFTTGILLPANLTVATHLLNTPIQPNLQGVILALEDVTEYPYRIDRLLTQWRMMGIFQQIKGIALGRFSRCEPDPETKSWTIAEVLRDRLGDLNLPLVYDLPFGHDGVNAILPVGQLVTLDGDTGSLSWELNSVRISTQNLNKT